MLRATSTRRAGTSIQHTGQVTSGKIFDDLIEPLLHTGQFHSHSFDSDYDAFEYAAGMVQSRSFHVNMENFITGETLEGEAAHTTTSLLVVSTPHDCL